MLQVVAGKNRGMPDRNPNSLLRKIKEIAEAGVPQQITRQRTTFFSHKYSNKDDIAAKQCRIVVPLNYPMLQLIPAGNDIETGNFLGFIPLRNAEKAQQDPQGIFIGAPSLRVIDIGAPPFREGLARSSKLDSTEKRGR